LLPLGCSLFYNNFVDGCHISPGYGGQFLRLTVNEVLWQAWQCFFAADRVSPAVKIALPPWENHMPTVDTAFRPNAVLLFL
jgi:hypothetical protein